MVLGEVRHRANRPRLGAQGERMLKGVNIARYNSGFSSPFLSFFIMSQFTSLTDEEHRDKMTMLRSIILFLYPHARFHYYLHSSTSEYPKV